MKKRFSIFSRLSLGLAAAFTLHLYVVRGGFDTIAVNVAAGQPPKVDAAAAGSTASGDVLLDSAITKLRTQYAVTARVRVQVDLFGQQLYGSGRYAQKGRGADRSFRFELSVPGSDQQNVLIHVNDGRQWWRYEELEGPAKLSVVDLARLREAMAGARSQILPTPNEQLALGGLPQLMHSLQDNFQFGPAVRTSWNQLDVWATRGDWRREQLSRLVDESKKKPDGKPSSQLLARLPRQIHLYLDASTLFPHRIEFLANQPSVSSAKQKPAQPLVVMELFEVRFTVRPDESLFDRPSDLPAVDVTDRYLRRLGLADRISQASEPKDDQDEKRRWR